VELAITKLDDGQLRVAEIGPTVTSWCTNG
jgi:hypothetical protein